ncbi:helix-turn-helix domain-containing protein [Mesorhizobium sp. Root157]|uniref:helix-turn-helix domain-containing protein n=1 Tax=Mesorhizobium sp. Root157 TaxID=1736477 RepID=UPI00191007D1|nr:helix-turn-helix transcriptional regulator [Mesorhizobium sp. Root157]
MTPEQCRAARALKDWTQSDLAKASGVSDLTIRNFERSKTTLQPATLQVLRTALEAAGVLFIDSNGNGPGVRLRDRLKQ